MLEHPIIFSRPMVRAIKSGRKTQTRRVAPPARHGNTLQCPYGVPGDRLWVRETFRIKKSKTFCDTVFYNADDLKGNHRWTPSIYMPRWASRITLDITGVRLEQLQDISESDAEAEGVEKSGGWNADETEYGVNYRIPFSRLWDSINATRGYGWETNPRVWVITFRRLEDR